MGRLGYYSKLSFQAPEEVILKKIFAHGKASAFGFTVFPFVVQANALGHRLQSESNRKQ